MNSLILAAGLGTRLRPLTSLVPKPLVPVLNQPLIDMAIDWLRIQGITRFVVNTHYKAEQVRHHLNGLALRESLNISESFEPEILGTGGAVKNALTHMGGEFLVLWNSDVLFTPELGPVIEAHMESRALATLLLRRKDVGRFGGFARDPKGHLTSYLPSSDSSPPLHAGMYTGVMIINPEIAVHFPSTPVFCIIKDVIRPLIAAGERIRGVFTDESWNDLGNPDAYYRANFSGLSQLEHGSDTLSRFLQSLIERRGYENRGNGFWAIPGQNQVPAEGPAMVGPNVVCGRDVALGSRVIIGPDARIYGVGLLENSIVWPGSEAVLRSPTGSRTIRNRIYAGNLHCLDIAPPQEDIAQLPPG